MNLYDCLWILVNIECNGPLDDYVLITLRPLNLCCLECHFTRIHLQGCSNRDAKRFTLDIIVPWQMCQCYGILILQSLKNWTIVIVKTHYQNRSHLQKTFRALRKFSGRHNRPNVPTICRLVNKTQVWYWIIIRHHVFIPVVQPKILLWCVKAWLNSR